MCKSIVTWRRKCFKDIRITTTGTKICVPDCGCIPRLVDIIFTLTWCIIQTVIQFNRFYKVNIVLIGYKLGSSNGVIFVGGQSLDSRSSFCSQKVKSFKSEIFPSQKQRQFSVVQFSASRFLELFAYRFVSALSSSLPLTTRKLHFLIISWSEISTRTYTVNYRLSRLQNIARKVNEWTILSTE